MFIKEEWSIIELVKHIRESEEKELYFNWENYTDENLKKMSDMLNEIDSLDENYTVIIGFNKVREAELSGALNLSKINVRISLDMYTYSLEEFNLMNDQLNKIIKDIKPDSSPFEKYTQIYNIVRNYKEYKVIDQSNVTDFRQLINNKNQSANLKYILDGEYMDCHGFSVLLQTLLNKCDIESYDFGFKVNLPDGTKAGHSRVIVNLDDDKYDIHGLFISDPTWDSQNKADELEFFLLPIESMREPVYDECKETLLFDATTEEEFSNNITTFQTCLDDPNKLTTAVITMVNRIDRKESAKLKTMEADQIYSELEQYILTRSNTNIMTEEHFIGGRDGR